MAGSSVTQAHYKLGNIKKVVFTCTADDTDGSFPATAISEPIDGFLLMLETNPDGGTAPQDDYDIVITDVDGLDILAGVGANRDTATSEIAVPVIGTFLHMPVTPDATYTLAVTGNNVNDAITVISLYYGS